MRQETKYIYKPEVIKVICEAKKYLIKNSQLIVRIHPLHYNQSKIKNYTQIFKLYNQLQLDYKDILKINYPVFKDNINTNFFDKENTSDLHFQMRDVIINVFSTINIEGAIFDKPLINICYQTNTDFYDKNIKSRYDINIDFQQDHNQRILKSGAILNFL